MTNSTDATGSDRHPRAWPGGPSLFLRRSWITGSRCFAAARWWHLRWGAAGP